MIMKKLISILTAAMALTMAVPCYAEGSINKGDLNGDQRTDITDLMCMAAHVKGIKAIDEERVAAADINDDGDVNVTDLNMLAAHVKCIRSFNGQSDKISDLKTVAYMLKEEFKKEKDKVSVNIDESRGIVVVKSFSSDIDAAEIKKRVLDFIAENNIYPATVDTFNFE